MGNVSRRRGGGIREQLATARRVCFDSNSIIYHLNRNEPYAEIVGKLFEAIRDGAKEGFASVVSELEVLVRPIRDATPRDLERARSVLDGPGMHVVDLDRPIARHAAQIRAASRLDLADAVIVATAVATGCDLIVGNDARCAQRVREVPYVLLDDVVA